MFRYMIIISALTAFLQAEAAVKLSLYYESLCPDSRDFIISQLNPTYAVLKEEIDVDFVPFGNAQAELIDDKWNFTCQHGPNECYGNIIHACAISKVSQEVSVEFITCAMSWENRTLPLEDYEKLLQECSTASSISWEDLLDCYNNEGDELLVENGRRTNELVPALTWVPWVISNGNNNATFQEEATVDLLGALCRAFSEEISACNNKH